MACYYNANPQINNFVGCPMILRADRGTENTNIAFLQPFFRDKHDDSFAKERSFMYSRSTSNQVCLLEYVSINRVTTNYT